jgi:hypothetical protein
MDYLLKLRALVCDSTSTSKHFQQGKGLRQTAQGVPGPSTVSTPHDTRLVPADENQALGQSLAELHL